jgi:hypothetical protein
VVLHEDHRAFLAQLAGLVEDPAALVRMGPHPLHLPFVQGTRLVDNLGRDAGLAEIVEEEGRSQLPHPDLPR